MKQLLMRAFVSLAASGCWAQGPLYDRVVVELPFPVHVQGKVLDPGKYTIEEHKSAADTGILHIFSDGGLELEATVKTIDTLDRQTANDTKVVLHNFGSDYYFDKIWIQGKNYGYEFVLPENVKSRERERRESLNLPGKWERQQPAMDRRRPAEASAKRQPTTGAASRTAGNGRGRERLIREVRHELVMLPYYSVFDHLAYKVQDGSVTLTGQVTRPTLKSSAENVVQGIEGVERVANNIEVLPVSPNDDRLRRAVYDAIYGHTALSRYALQAVPPIHIIVKNGNITLEGVVATESEKTIAGTQAKGVSGAFSVANNLRVEKM